METIVNAVKESLAGKHNHHKLPKVIRIWALLLLLLSGLLCYWDIFGGAIVTVGPLWSAEFSDSLEMTAKVSIICLFVYELMQVRLLAWIIQNVGPKGSNMWEMIILSALDVVEWSATLVLCMVTIDELATLFSGKEFGSDLLIYTMSCIYLGTKFFAWIWNNEGHWLNEQNKEYSNFYDTNSNRIAQGDYVIYHHRGYQVKYITPLGKSRDEREWVISEFSLGNGAHEIPLEAAVADKDGGLIVCNKKWFRC